MQNSGFYARNEDMHEILDEFEVRPDLTTDCGVEKNPHIFIMGK